MKALVDLSQQQIDDAMYLRRVYISRRGTLLRKRQSQLAACLGGKQSTLLHANDSLHSLSEMAVMMKEHAMQDYEAYHQLCFAMFRGVSLSCIAKC